MNSRYGRCCALRAVALFVVAFGAVLAPAGCSSRSARKAIEGTVTLDGKPLQVGYISFRPEQDTKGPTAGAEISAGKFSIPASGGVFAGWFRVQITATRPGVLVKTFDRSSGKMVQAPTMEQYLPAHYNTESTLRAEVSEGCTDPFAFTLQSSKKASPY